MAHHKSALKRIKTNAKANLKNRQYRSMMRTAIRRVREAEDTESRSTALRSAGIILDRMATKGIIHKNTAARRKSRLAIGIAKLESISAQ